MFMMPDRDIIGTTRVRLALLLLVVAALLFVVATVQAVRLDPPPSTAPSNVAKRNGRSLAIRTVQVDPEAVVENDIFSEDRVPAPERYLMPGEVRDKPQVVVAPPPPKPTVLGTAIGSDGSAFATAQLPGGSPRIIRVGDQFGVFKVVAISRGTVTFRAADSAPFQVNTL